MEVEEVGKISNVEGMGREKKFNKKYMQELIKDFNK